MLSFLSRRVLTIKREVYIGYTQIFKDILQLSTFNRLRKKAAWTVARCESLYVLLAYRPAIDVLPTEPKVLFQQLTLLQSNTTQPSEKST